MLELQAFLKEAFPELKELISKLKPLDAAVIALLLLANIFDDERERPE
jgi:hypothetical protein